MSTVFTCAAHPSFLLAQRPNTQDTRATLGNSRIRLQEALLAMAKDFGFFFRKRCWAKMDMQLQYTHSVVDVGLFASNYSYIYIYVLAVLAVRVS